MKPFIANTKGQQLDYHLFAVGYLARTLILSFTNNDIILGNLSFIAGITHDIGKIDQTYASWVNNKNSKSNSEDGCHISGKFSFDKYPRHNEVSLLLYHLLKTKNKFNTTQHKIIEHAIYWHHARPLRKKLQLDYVSHIHTQLVKNSTDFDDLLSSTISVFNNVFNFANEYGLPNLQDNFSESYDAESLDDDIKVPDYKRYRTGNTSIDEYKTDITLNAKCDLIRSAVITADRLVSNCSPSELQSLVTDKRLDSLLDVIHPSTNLSNDIKECIDRFNTHYPNSDRNKSQADAVTELMPYGTAVLSGPAGVGKTKIALEWAMRTNAQKLIWICPRIQICQAIFAELTSSEYLPNTTIELKTSEFSLTYENGECKETTNLFTGDIIITNIDTIMDSIITHHNVTALMDFMSSHVVFDEFHEYIPIDGFNLLFSELVKCKRLHDKNLLMVSATPNYYFVNNVLDIDSVVSIDSFNKSTYILKFDEFTEKVIDDSNPFYAKQEANTFIISNTISTAQQAFLHRSDENSILFHSSYTKTDKVEIFNKIMSSFGKDGNNTHDILRSGPIIQASLNISCNKMFTEITNPDNWLQRLGRLNRFGELDECEYITLIPDNFPSSSTASILRNHTYSFESAAEWYSYLKNKAIKRTTLSELYNLYKDFHNDYKSIIESELLKAFNHSAKNVVKCVPGPIDYPVKNTKATIKRKSLRGNSRYVNMATATYDGTFTIHNDYLCGDDVCFTMGVNRITGYDTSDKNLLNYMVNKHHRMTGDKKPYKDFIVLNKACSKESPIFVSYTPEDLERINETAHKSAIYYVYDNRQPVGAMTITNEGEI